MGDPKYGEGPAPHDYEATEADKHSTHSHKMPEWSLGGRLRNLQFEQVADNPGPGDYSMEGRRDTAHRNPEDIVHQGRQKGASRRATPVASTLWGAERYFRFDESHRTEAL